MISATFSLVQQLVHFHAMPAVKVIHTSSFVQGQVFVPVINVLLCIGTLGLVGGFGTGAGLTAAYGFAVSTVFIGTLIFACLLTIVANISAVTTTFIAISIVRVKHLPVILAIAFALGMGFIDVLFWGASVKKIPEGNFDFLRLSSTSPDFIDVQVPTFPSLSPSSSRRSSSSGHGLEDWKIDSTFRTEIDCRRLSRRLTTPKIELLRSGRRELVE